MDVSPSVAGSLISRMRTAGTRTVALGMLRRLIQMGPKDPDKVGDLDEPRLMKPPSRIDVSTERDTAAFGAQITHIINRPDSIRQRAQNAATICGAAAAALAAFGALTGLDRGPEPLAALGLALILWLLSMLLYIKAIVFSWSQYEERRERKIQDKHADKHGEARGSGGGDERSLSLEDIVTRFRKEATWMRQLVRDGHYATVAATFCTVVAVGVLVAGFPETDKPLTVSLTEGARAAVGQTCQWQTGSRTEPSLEGLLVPARVRLQDLTKPVVRLRLAKGTCGTGDATLRVRNATIVATAEVANAELSRLNKHYTAVRTSRIALQREQRRLQRRKR